LIQDRIFRRPEFTIIAKNASFSLENFPNAGWAKNFAWFPLLCEILADPISQKLTQTQSNSRFQLKNLKNSTEKPPALPSI
jgi:hypothetical protein